MGMKYSENRYPVKYTDSRHSRNAVIGPLLLVVLVASTRLRGDNSRVAKQCPECRTVADDASPNCEACGCQFAIGPAVPSSSGRKFLSLVIVAVLVIALVAYVRYC
jgi:hypothetical protein